MTQKGFKITINGIPKPKSRPRFSTKNGKAYNSQKKEMIVNSFLISSQYRGPIIATPVSIEIIFFMPIPKSLSIKKQQNLEHQYHATKPDVDNLEKKLLDEIIMSKAILIDDNQIAIMNSSKVYSFNPRTEFLIKPLKENEKYDQ